MFDRPTASPRVNFEALETRRMLAQINVTAHGATPDDGADDTAAIQRVLTNISGPCDEVIFPAGVYDVKATLTFRHSNQTIKGLTGATLRWERLTNRLYGGVFYKDSSDITVTGLKF